MAAPGRPEVAWFRFRGHAAIQELSNALLERSLRPQNYELLLVRKPDERRDDLECWRRALRERLEGEFGLRLKHPEARVLRNGGSLDALGFRIRRSGVEPLPVTWRRLRRRLSDHVRARGPLAAPPVFERAIQSMAGNLRFPW